MSKDRAKDDERDEGVATIKFPDGATLDGTYVRTGRTVTTTFRGTEVGKPLPSDSFRLNLPFQSNADDVAP